ncbi:glutamate-rich protein 1 isoform X2 [Peromyscus californicus insignis]|uniref:glutamate-rich protein 1 isoform X2 n=1 Tax=Peromyscus californicus insignis TaxID=564181 RepID=UPI0022A6A6C7|nr:glutamate-rich protein 1 isoform X2 [Peromyscus californicus insignis]
MSAHRKHGDTGSISSVFLHDEDWQGTVFTEKVLKRLFPNVSSGGDKGTPQTPALETPPKNVTPEAVQHKHDHRPTDGDIKTQPERRLYTVSLPPPGYIPSLPEPASCANSENASSGGDTEAELDHHDQPKRKRIRKRKSKKNIKNLNDVAIKQAELEMQPGLSQEKVHPEHPDAPKMSKNKRKKLKKKLQLRRKKAAGLVKAVGITFLYQPESSSEADGDYVERGEAEGDQEGSVSGPTQEDIELANSKADSLLSFLKSTQEIYFYDDTSKDIDPAVCVETTEELLSLLESRSMPPSDVLILDHMKTLLLLQDTERLQSALKMFPEHCMMPPVWQRVKFSVF